MTCKLTGKISPVGILAGSLQNVSSLNATLTAKVFESLEYEHYSGSMVVVPSSSEQTLLTSHKVVDDNIRVTQIPTFEVSNLFDGTTFYIGGSPEVI